MIDIKRSRLLMAALLVIPLMLAGCLEGDDGAPGVDGADVDPAVVENLQSQIDALSIAGAESCEICHSDDGSIAQSGAAHQADYEEFYQDQVIKVSNVSYNNDGVSDIVTFTMKKDGVDFDCNDATTNPEPDLSDSLNIYFTEYTGTGFEMPNDPAGNADPDGDRVSIKGTLEYLGGGVCRSTKPTSHLGPLGGKNGLITIFGRDGTLFADPDKHIASAAFPFATILTLGAVDYESKANAEGCERCHTRPFLKHTYIYGEVGENGAPNDGNDFYVCKSCHLDNGSGGHEDWQILADNPTRHAEIAAGDDLTPEEEAKYAYKTRLMNDVHMAHSMEFGFPQSMKTCNTCHEGKLDLTLTDENFNPETCISCHAIDGLLAILPADIHVGFTAENLKGKECNLCHSVGSPLLQGPLFSEIHTGFDPEIYADGTSTKYSEAFTVAIEDDTSFDAATNTLTIKFSATEVTPVTGLAVTDIVPTVMVGLYGYDTKHYIIPPHGRDADRNRLTEYVVGEDHPRFTTVSAAGGAWEVTADLSMWADMIADGTIKRAEIGVMPALYLAVGEVDDDVNLEEDDVGEVAMNAPSRTFDLTALPAGAFIAPGEPGTFDVVDVLGEDENGGCNSCHDALATTFHSGKRGGNIKICKMCHVPSSAGSHLEMQSRSIDSYVHAIHSFQDFDIGDIDFSDPVEAAEHSHKIKSDFPRFGIKNCEACHNPGTYGVPDQSKSLPSLHSGSDDVADRNIGTVPRYVMGPAARACGACHRAQMINDDDAGKLAAFNGHVKTFGYLIEDSDGLWDAVVKQVMSMF